VKSIKKRNGQDLKAEYFLLW